MSQIDGSLLALEIDGIRQASNFSAGSADLVSMMPIEKEKKSF